MNPIKRVKEMDHPVSTVDMILKEVVWWTNGIIAVPVITLLAAMLPGDMINANTVGAVALIVMFVVLDLMITVPCVIGRRKIRRAHEIPDPVLRSVK